MEVYYYSSNPPHPPFLKGGLILPKIPRKGAMEKLLKGWRILRRDGGGGQGGLQERVNAVSLGILPSCGVANVTTVTFNYILVIMFLFPFNVGVSPCFDCSVSVPVYRMYTSCFRNTVVSSCYRLHTLCLHHAGVTSSFSLSMWF